MVISKLSSIRRKNGDFLPWKKFVFPDPLAPTAKKKNWKDIIKVTNKYNSDAFIIWKKRSKFIFRDNLTFKWNVIKEKGRMY